MDAQSTERRFVEIISEWLISLPHDLKILFEAKDDENLDRSARELAVGTILYVISPNDLVADRHDNFTSYCDDAILVRMVLAQVVSDNDEDTEFFKSRFPDFFDDLEEELAICKNAMGELYEWLESKIPTLPKMEHKGKKVRDYITNDEDGETLFDEGLAFRTEYPVEEETLADKLKKASTVLEVIKRRKAEEARVA